jgi:hypothetical protein
MPCREDVNSSESRASDTLTSRSQLLKTRISHFTRVTYMNIKTLLFASFVLIAAIPAVAQEPVVGKADESLFTDKDPRLHTNK